MPRRVGQRRGYDLLSRLIRDADRAARDAGGSTRDMDAPARQSTTSGVKASDVDALTGGNREREAIVRIRHASVVCHGRAHGQSDSQAAQISN